MFVADCLGLNEAGHLTIGTRDTVELAQTFGTPLYVMDAGQIRQSCRSYKQSIEQFYAGNGLVAYASKALCCKALCRMVMEEGLGLDVVSAGELFTAMSVNFPAEKIFFHGNNKTPQELVYALECNVGHIVVDNVDELALLAQLAKAAGKVANILLRIKPGIDAHTHDFIRTGQIDSKFGLALETGEALEAVKQALAQPSLKLVGIHCHIGSQIFDIAPFALAAEVMVGFMAEVKAQTGHLLRLLNLGGGFGIPYIPSHDPVEYKQYMQEVSSVITTSCQKLGLAMPFVVIEPGRSIVGSAGITLYHVGGVKDIPGVRRYVSVDGGMTDNPRYALYQSAYEFLVANRAGSPKGQIVTIAGKCCESGDLLGKDIQLQDCHAGDILAVLATGAYNYSMSSNYNRNPRPAMVLVEDGDARVIVKAETLEDLVRNDV